MSDPIPTRDPQIPPAPPVSEPIAYRPLAGFAVAGVAIASLFALLVLVAAVVALYQARRFSTRRGSCCCRPPPWCCRWWRSQIRSSEGTRAGEALAGAGVWISLLFGLGYFVYFYVTGLAVQSQANSFLTEIGPDSGFFPHLQNAATNRTDYYAAFLESLPAINRGGVRPEDEAGILRKFDESKPDGGPSPLAAFRKHPIVRMLTTAPPGQVQVESLGVQAWDYEERSYKVRRLYRITTPEAAVEFSIPAWSNEGETAGEQRRWYVPLQYIGKPTPKQIKFTPLGMGLQHLRFSSQRFVTLWRQVLGEGQSYKDFAAKDRTEWKRLPQLNEDQQGYLQGRLQDLFLSEAPRRLDKLQLVIDDNLSLGEWLITPDNKVQTLVGFRLPLEPAGKQLPFMLDGIIYVETRGAVDPLSFAEAPRDVEWDIHKIVITRAAPVTAKKDDKLAPAQ